MSLLVVGSVALDDVETPEAKAEGILGGAASFASVAAARFAKVELVGIVGSDFPEEHIEMFKSQGVGTQALEVKEGKTFHWEGRYHEDMVHRDTLMTELGVFEDWSPVIPESLRKMPFVFLGNIHPQLQLDVLDQMEEPKLVGCDTMNLWINIARDELEQVIKRTNILIINDEEARMLTEVISLHKAARMLQEMGPEIIIIKRGEHGASVHGKDRLFFAPAYPLDDVTDTTGAGDTFAGAMMGYLTQQNSDRYEDVCRGVLNGSVLASFAVEGFSLKRLAESTATELEERMNILGQMVRV